MAKAIGGEVINNIKLAELGTIELKLTKKGQKDPIFGKMEQNFLAQMGHEDIVIKKPDKSIVLASSKKLKLKHFVSKINQFIVHNFIQSLELMT